MEAIMSERDKGKDESARNRPSPIALQKALKGVDYPATRGALVSAARESGADDEIVDALEAIPEKRYEDPAQVSEAVAHRCE
ncbi:DUF2795 domain-containing protein [Cupriavidus pinatubonensis]|uniref:DUF2795 domain-containing protein n=1 Tax=Cupriavidus pinatubonensis TaxID=248026 RepID=UPI001FD3ABA0|nr:DUF2795 domain-containing protein [Cupriavidus pinatubonensis]